MAEEEDVEASLIEDDAEDDAYFTDADELLDD
jgi:hypothetical protein